MLSDDRVRAEVKRIANGIEVNTDAHLAAVIARTRGQGRARTPRVGGSRRRRLLVTLTAAASVIGAVVAGTTLTGILTGGEPDVDRVAPVVLAGTPDGTVPSVFGHTRESASALLGERGLEVRYGKQMSCDPAGRPVGTEPTTGPQCSRAMQSRPCCRTRAPPPTAWLIFGNLGRSSTSPPAVARPPVSPTRWACLWTVCERGRCPERTRHAVIGAHTRR